MQTRCVNCNGTHELERSTLGLPTTEVKAIRLGFTSAAISPALADTPTHLYASLSRRIKLEWVAKMDVETA